jgi:hypothetical protein
MKRPLLLAALALAACDVDRAIVGNPDLTMPTPPDMTCVPLPSPKIDVLLMVDNSFGMAPMQTDMAARLDQFLQPFQDFGNVDLHLGVVTSDYGAGATGAPGCQSSPGGQLGRLQRMGPVAPPNCQPPVGDPFIAWQASGNNLPMGQDLVTTLACIVSSIGTAGCGFEHPLESVYAALHNPDDNPGFLRPDAALLIVFLTNEDDCSAPPTSNLFDKNRTATYGYEDSFRCTRFGVFCGGQPVPYSATIGPLGNCTPGHPTELYDVARYIEFFTHLKEDPRKVALAAIDADAAPVAVVLSNPGTPAGEPYAECEHPSEITNPPCVPVVQHSCHNPDRPAHFGDPAVRLNAVVAAAPNHLLRSICDADFSKTLFEIAHLGLTAATCR